MQSANNFKPPYAESLALPFRRRAEITFRPDAVAIRALNPWRRFLTRRLG